ncbi:MAG: hypothetical protein M3020_02110, partial [Myxococcota bacterium]|nr:hypothetical protein [Myxococcota bacterium]
IPGVPPFGVAATPPVVGDATPPVGLLTEPPLFELAPPVDVPPVIGAALPPVPPVLDGDSSELHAGATGASAERMKTDASALFISAH